MRKNYYYEYKAKGLCYSCGEAQLDKSIYCKRCRERSLKHSRISRKIAKQKGLCTRCKKSPRVKTFSMCQPCLEVNNTKSKQVYQKRRQLCIENYGGCCSCCGCRVHKYLQLDHVNNDGSDHEVNGKRIAGNSLYAWAIQNSYPKMLQLMCSNCHQAKTTNGGCTEEDHKLMKKTRS